MTPECLAPILESLDAFMVRTPESLPPLWRDWDFRLALATSEARAGEAGVGDSGDDPYAPRREALDQEFRELPAAGSTAYWARIETQGAGRALALEVLVRCMRERLAAGDRDAAYRVFTLLHGQVRFRTEQWARQMARRARSDREQMAEELAEECAIALWTELADPAPTFLQEHFVSALNRIQQHVATAVLLKQGEMQRKGVAHATRVPSGLQDSLNVPPRADDQVPLTDRLADRAADVDFERAELSDLMAEVERLPEEQRSLVYERYLLDRSAEEMAQARGITAHTVRNRLKPILAGLKRAYQGGEEVEHGSQQ